MKKIAMALTVCVFAAMSAGCSREPAVKESSEKQVRISSSPIDPEIIGTWENEQSAYRFQEDRQVSLPMDFSWSAHFESDGSFIMDDIVVGTDEIEYDGTELTVRHVYEELEENNELLLLNMKRKDGAADKNSYDGVYDLLDGSFFEMFAYNFGMDKDKINIEAVIDGESFFITIVDYCYYETLGDSLELFSENMDYVDENASAVKYKYQIDGDTLTLTYGEEEPQTFTKVKE